jgi:hypothetical protein
MTLLAFCNWNFARFIISGWTMLPMSWRYRMVGKSTTPDRKRSRTWKNWWFVMEYSSEGNTICPLGDAASWPVAAAIRHFKGIWISMFISRKIKTGTILLPEPFEKKQTFLKSYKVSRKVKAKRCKRLTLKQINGNRRSNNWSRTREQPFYKQHVWWSGESPPAMCYYSK